MRQIEAMTRATFPRAGARPEDHGSQRLVACNSVLGSSHFTHSYCENPGWSLLLHLLLCSWCRGDRG